MTVAGLELAPVHVARAVWIARQFLLEQERWVLWLPMAVAAGIGAYFLLPSEPPLWIGMAGSAAALLLVWAWRRSPLLPLVIASAGFAAGFAAAELRAALVAAPVLTRALPAVTILGRVERIVPRDDAAWLIIREPSIERLDPRATPARIRLRAAETSVAGLVPGDRIRIRASLTPPPGPAAPGAFDFRRDLWFSGIGATGFPLSRPQRLDRPPEAAVATRIERLRQVIFQRVTDALPGENGALAAALMMGERGAMPPELIAAMRDSGLQHLLSISGLHIGLIAGLVFFALRALLALIPFVALRFPIKKYAAGAAGLAAFGYLLLSGAEVPAERAFLMTAIVLFAIMVDRSALSIGLLAWAAIAVLLLEPEALLGASFQLSFAAMLALIAAYEALGPGLKAQLQALPGPTKLLLYVAGSVLSSLVAGLATGIIGLFHFNRIAVYGLAANALAIPATSLWVMPWAIVSFLLMPFGLEAYGLSAMSHGLALITGVARTVAAWPGATHLVPALVAWPLPLAAFGLLWLCIWRRPWRILGVPMMAGALYFGFTAAPPDVLVSDDGGLMAVRATDGTLLFSSARGHGFERMVWLERDGATSGGAFPREGEGARGPLGCDSAGCSYRSAGLVIALARSRVAIDEDCRRADILITTEFVLGACPRPRVVIDGRDLRRKGSHAIWLAGSEIEVRTAAGGARPWSGAVVSGRSESAPPAAPAP